MLKYFNYLNDKKEFETRINELKWLLGHSEIYDRYGEQKVRYEGMSNITFDIKCQIDIYERWLERLNNLTFKQRLTYEGTEFF